MRSILISSTEANELKRTRNLLLLATAAYLLWGFYLPQLILNIFDPIWFRALTVGVVLTCYFATFAKNYRRKHQELILFIPSLMMTGHSFVISYFNAYPLIIVIGLYILAGAIFNCLAEPRSLVVFSAFFLLGSLPNFIDATAHFPGSVALICSSTVIIVGSYTAFTRRITYLELKKSEQLQSAILNHMIEGVVLIDQDLKILSLNHAAQEILGFEQDQLVLVDRHKMPLRSHNSDGSAMSLADHPVTKSLTEQKTIESFAMKIDRKGITRDLLVSVIPLFEREGQPAQKALMSFQDITEEKRTEEVLLQQRAVLETTSRLTSLGEMAAGVAHEINNPLAIMDGRAHQLQRLLKQQLPEDHRAFEFIQNIRSTAARISRIIKSMKGLSKSSPSEPFEYTSINEIVEDTVNLCKEKFVDAGINLMMGLEDGLMVRCRPHQISQVILNLLHNSFDAIQEQQNKWIRVSSLSTDKWVEVRVEDSGPGVPEKVREKIMQPFFTTKEIGKGTGLGLSISRNIAQGHNGDLVLDETAKNTCFVLRIPFNIDKSDAA